MACPAPHPMRAPFPAAAGEAWQSLPSGVSRLLRLADNCLLVEPHNNAAAGCVRLDVEELQRAATLAAVSEHRVTLLSSRSVLNSITR